MTFIHHLISKVKVSNYRCSQFFTFFRHPPYCKISSAFSGNMADLNTKIDYLDGIRRFFANEHLCERPISAYIIPHDDQHLSEYLAATDMRLQHVCGFTGSAGTVVITKTDAFLWTDGRYFIQADLELKPPFALKKIDPVSPTPAEWLSANLKSGDCVGADSSLFSCSEWQTITSTLQSSGISLITPSANFVDYIWADQPPRPVNSLSIVHRNYSGRSASDKIEEIVSVMRTKGVQIVIIPELDNIAWLLNLRGTDIPYNPVFFAFVLIDISENDVSVNLFIDSLKVTPEILQHFEVEGIKVLVWGYDEVYTRVSLLAQKEHVKKVWVSTTSNYKLLSIIPPQKRFQEPSLVTKLKAVKNQTEAEGMIKAHIKDGYALSSYLHWLEEEIKSGRKVTEISGATKLEGFRAKEGGFRGLSFPTISSVGEHGAIIHYLPAVSSDKEITDKEIYLVDSGGQYWDGTTDVTRTIHFGTPTEFQKECFTLVLKGVVSLSTAIFPAKLKGNVLDSFARQHLWNVGLQYGHGTGHGIGSNLCVHEGPMGVSWRALPNDPGLEANMFISNEPGYYRKDEFGVRIENIEQITRATTKYEPDHQFLTFNTITMCPISRKLLNVDLLNTEEVKWLNNYHQRVRNTLVPIAESRGDSELKKWIIRETEPIA